MDFKVTTEVVNSHNYAQWRLKGLSTLCNKCIIETGNTDRSTFSRFSLKHVCKDYLFKCITFPVAIG